MVNHITYNDSCSRLKKKIKELEKEITQFRSQKNVTNPLYNVLHDLDKERDFLKKNVITDPIKVWEKDILPYLKKDRYEGAYLQAVITEITNDTVYVQYYHKYQMIHEKDFDYAISKDRLVPNKQKCKTRKNNSKLVIGEIYIVPISEYDFYCIVGPYGGTKLSKTAPQKTPANFINPDKYVITNVENDGGQTKITKNCKKPGWQAPWCYHLNLCGVHQFKGYTTLFQLKDICGRANSYGPGEFWGKPKNVYLKPTAPIFVYYRPRDDCAVIKKNDFEICFSNHDVTPNGKRAFLFIQNDNRDAGINWTQYQEEMTLGENFNCVQGPLIV